VGNTIIGARDVHGFRPLCLGKLDNSYVLASESCALDLIGAKFIREIDPGERSFRLRRAGTGQRRQGQRLYAASPAVRISRSAHFGFVDSYGFKMKIFLTYRFFDMLSGCDTCRFYGIVSQINIRLGAN